MAVKTIQCTVCGKRFIPISPTAKTTNICEDCLSPGYYPSKPILKGQIKPKDARLDQDKDNAQLNKNGGK